jgi:hypothetical protein
LTSQPERMEPGSTLLRIVNNDTASAFLTIVDNAGQVVWYSTVLSTLDVRQLPDGNLFLPMVTNFLEINLLGETVQSWNVPVD